MEVAKNMGKENEGKWRRIVSRTNARPFSVLFIISSFVYVSQPAITTNFNGIDSF